MLNDREITTPDIRLGAPTQDGCAPAQFTKCGIAFVQVEQLGRVLARGADLAHVGHFLLRRIPLPGLLIIPLSSTAGNGNSPGGFRGRVGAFALLAAARHSN